MELRIAIFVFSAGILRTERGFGLQLEADCNTPPASPIATTFAQPTVPEFAFRTDRVTRKECRKFKYLIPCSPVEDQLSCNHVRADDKGMFDPRSKTYLVIECGKRDRTEMVQLLRNITGESPTRAITLSLKERTGADDTIHAEVFEPIRNQLIDLTVTCATNSTTRKVYDVGVLPSLFRLVMRSGRNMTIRKQDFTRLPRILIISFETSTIEAMEPGTFSNLPLLQSLQLESAIPYQLNGRRHSIEAEDYRHWGFEFMDWDVQKVHRLHCDCSFVWLRNFIKAKPDLFGRKGKGEVFVVGNYLSPFVHDIHLRGDMQLLSVDCSRNLTESNTNVGSEFSYNTSCYTCSK